MEIILSHRPSCHRPIVLSLLCLFALAVTGCETAPPTASEKSILEEQATFTLGMMQKQDPALDEFLSKAYAYVVFPTVSKGGLIAGGVYGRGVVYEKAGMIGYADLSQATIGGQIGGQTYSELLVLEDEAAMNRFKTGKLTFETNLSAIALQKGTAQHAKYHEGVIAFIRPQGGLMAEATVGGQQFTYIPKTAAERLDRVRETP